MMSEIMQAAINEYLDMITEEGLIHQIGHYNLKPLLIICRKYNLTATEFCKQLDAFVEENY